MTEGADTDTDVIDVLVRRAGTEGLSTADYATELRDRLAPEFTVRRATTPAEEAELVRRARVVTGNDLDEELLAAAEDLSLFACTFSGVDHLPKDPLRERGITVTNASGIHAPGIAEQVLAFLLAFARDLPTGLRHQQERRWQHYRPGELQGSTVTVVGLGAIGSSVADRLEPFGVETLGVRHTPEKGGPTDEVVGFDRDAIHNCLARSEYVVLACPLTAETRGLLDADAFATLEPDSVVVNVSRGGVVDTEALVRALRTESIRGAALDVVDPEPLPADHPLWDLENVLVTPHVGGHTPEHWSRRADVVAHNVRVLFGEETGELRNAVDLTA